MALIKCEECGREISDKAITCPHCGAPISNNVQKTYKEMYNESSSNDKESNDKDNTNNVEIESHSMMPIIGLVLGICSLVAVIIAVLYTGTNIALVALGIGLLISVAGIVLNAITKKKVVKKSLVTVGLILSIIGASLCVIGFPACVSCTALNNNYSSNSKIVVAGQEFKDSGKQYIIEDVVFDNNRVGFDIKCINNSSSSQSFWHSGAKIFKPSGERLANCDNSPSPWLDLKSGASGKMLLYSKVSVKYLADGKYTLECFNKEFEFRKEGNKIIYDSTDGEVEKIIE